MNTDFVSLLNRRIELYNEIFRLCEQEGLKPNKQRMQRKMNDYNIEDIERILDAFERFGISAILCNF